MILHFARALSVRHRAAMSVAPDSTARAAANSSQPVQPGPLPVRHPAPVRPRPITPWGAPVKATAVRITVDPQDARRTVIAGRFAEVCAALDRLVREQEAMA